MTIVEDEPAQRLAYFPSADTQSVRMAVRSWVGGHTGGADSVAQRLGDAPWDRALWRSIAGTLGVGQVLLPEGLGGLGAGYEAYAATLEEVGRGLLTTPVLGSLGYGLGALLPLVDDSDAVAQLAAQVADGSVVVAVAVSDTSGDWSGPRPTVTDAGDGSVIDGVSGLVVDAPRADVLAVFAARSGTLGLYRVEAGAAEIRPRPGLDPSRELADVAFVGAPAQLLAEGDAAVRSLRHARGLARLAVAAESVGGAQSALDDAVRYALARRQFGKPIAAFQAVKHMCADSLLAIQEARAVLAYATWALDDGSPEAARALLSAKIAATEAYVTSAAHAVQVFGAMGTTREVSVQVHFRRARFLSLILGSNDTDRETLADLLGLSS